MELLIDALLLQEMHRATEDRDYASSNAARLRLVEMAENASKVLLMQHPGCRLTKADLIRMIETPPSVTAGDDPARRLPVLSETMRQYCVVSTNRELSEIVERMRRSVVVLNYDDVVDRDFFEPSCVVDVAGQRTHVAEEFRKLAHVSKEVVIVDRYLMANRPQVVARNIRQWLEAFVVKQCGLDGKTIKILSAQGVTISAETSPNDLKSYMEDYLADGWTIEYYCAPDNRQSRKVLHDRHLWTSHYHYVSSRGWITALSDPGLSDYMYLVTCLPQLLRKNYMCAEALQSHIRPYMDRRYLTEVQHT